MTDADRRTYYEALLAKRSEYEGVFYVGVTTTGVFCRPTCPARKPKLENCEFFRTAKEALLASFRPCKRCRPLSHPGHVTELVQRLVEAVEAEPDRRWRDEDFRALSFDASTARRGFKKRFGMTFVEYARARRMSLALQQLKGGESVIGAQLATGYASGSGFRRAFSRTLGTAPSRHKQRVLTLGQFDTPLGPMLAVADERALHLLEFADRRGLEGELERLHRETDAAIVPGCAEPLCLIERELGQYFAGALREFKTPTARRGSPFQQSVWEALTRISFGETRSYTDVAVEVNRPSAARAVARANGANVLALVVPCHRVIGADGAPCGYGGGVTRKAWLLEHERQRS